MSNAKLQETTETIKHLAAQLHPIGSFQLLMRKARVAANCRADIGPRIGTTWERDVMG